MLAIMSYKRFVLELEPEQMALLSREAAANFRPPREHARYLVLKALGVLPEKRNGAGAELDQSHPGATINHDAPDLKRNGERHA